MYSPDNLEIGSEIISVACVSAVSLCFGLKIAGNDNPTSYSRTLLLSIYGFSWAFDLIASMLTSTNNGNYVSCSLGFFNIAIVYFAAKIALYLYFIERIYIISVPRTSRLRSMIYVANLALLLPFAALIVLMVVYRITLVSQDFPYHCTIGMQLPASTTVLVYGILINLLYAAFFIKLSFFPNTAQQSVQHCTSLKALAKRLLLVAGISLIASTVNFAVLISQNGEERGLIAMMIASIDITIVATSIHWAVGNSTEEACSEKAPRGIDEKPTKLKPGY